MRKSLRRRSLKALVIVRRRRTSKTGRIEKEVMPLFAAYSAPFGGSPPAPPSFRGVRGHAPVFSILFLNKHLCEISQSEMSLSQISENPGPATAGALGQIHYSE